MHDNLTFTAMVIGFGLLHVVILISGEDFGLGDGLTRHQRARNERKHEKKIPQQERTRAWDAS